MKYGIQGKRRSFIQENTCFAPRNSFRSNWDIEFSRIGSQTDGRNLIDGLNKAIKIGWKLSLDAIKKCDW